MQDGIRIKSDRTSLARPASGAAASGAGRPKVEMLDDDEPAEETPEEKKARLGRQADVLVSRLCLHGQRAGRWGALHAILYFAV